MFGINQLKKNIQDRIDKVVDRQVEIKLSYLVPQLIEFHTSTKEKKQSSRDHTKDPYNNLKLYSILRDKLIEIGIIVKDIDIDISDFENWLEDFHEIYNFYHRMGDVHIEKCLQHYLTFRYLDLTNKDVYIDFGAETSPWAEVLNKRRIKSFRLDLTYKEGINGRNIGADASNTKLPDDFASALSLQCTYEHFMRDVDVRFLGEASRILNNIGRFTIVPLYIDDTYFITTSPYVNQKNVVIDKGAERIWRDDEYKEPFTRTYSPEAFKQRVYSNIPSDMIGQVFYFKNLSDVMRRFPEQIVYSFFMLYCKKKD